MNKYHQVITELEKQMKEGQYRPGTSCRLCAVLQKSTAVASVPY